MQGYVYLIGSSLFSWYKIGKSRTPKTRIEDLGILLPFKVEVFAIWRAEDHSLMEDALHDKYKEYHINGEWFRFDNAKIEEITTKDIPTSCRIYLKGDTDGIFSSFSNVEQDAPEGKVIRIKIKNLYSEEYSRQKAEEGKAKSALRKAERLAKEKEIEEKLERLKSLESNFDLNTTEAGRSVKTI